MSTPPHSSVDLDPKLALLEKWLLAAIAYVNEKRKSNRSKATLIKVTTLCLSGAATILLGLTIGGDAATQLKNTAFAFTSVVTVLNALEPFFNYRALWVEHERAIAAFNRLHDDVRFYKTGRAALEAARIEAFHAEYLRIWSELNDAWSRERRSGDPSQMPAPVTQEG